MLLIAGMLVGIFLNTLTHSTSVYAADATWDGHDLTYSNKKYTRLTDNNKVKKFNLPDNSLVYINEDKNKKEVKVIYFPSGEISSLSSATYAVYSFTPPDTYNQTDTSTISIDPPSENSTSTSCDVQGIGWFICPVSNWLADGIDFMYSALQQFLKTKPLETTNQNSGIYLAWVIMRNISNVAFIVAFLVIIYSQLTSVGISNYGVKKMIPRLVIAAVLVNLSFTICAILLDLSNIAGYAFQDAFMGIKNTISTVGENTSTWTWSEVIMLILSNGAFAAGAAYTISLGSELLPLALSAVVGIGLVLLLVLLIMAARQALIVILIIISPLAFVCYLLPGTEKWFKKWKDLFLTMLVFFPAFSVVFGGAQLAGILIIQNATGPNGGIMQILGMVVQVIPLALTPIILKFSGGVLGKFAGFVNDKNKGWYDKSKNWAKDKREITRNKKLSNENMRLKRLNPNSLRRWVDHNSRARKKSLETSQKNAENSFRNTARYKRLDLEARQASRRADLLSEQDSNRYLEATQGYMTDNIYKLPFYDRALRAKSTKYSNWRDAKSYQQQAQFMSDIKDLETEIAMAGLIKNNAQRQQHSEFAEQLINSKELREKAGGNVFKDANGNLIGANAALASAIATSRSEYAKSVDEARQIIKHYKLSSEERQGLALGRISINLPGGVRLTRDSIFVREATIEEQVKYGTAAEVAELLSELPPEFRASAASALAESGIKSRANFMGGKLIDDMLKGDINNRSDLMNYFANWLEGGKYKPETLAPTDADAVKLLIEAVNTTSVITDKRRQKLKKVIDTILTDKRLSANATDAAKEQFKIFRNML